MSYQKRIEKALKLSGLTQEKVAERIKLLPGGTTFKQQTFSRVKSLKKGTSYLPHIAAACHVSPIWLAFGIGDIKYKDAQIDWERLAELIIEIEDKLHKSDIYVPDEMKICAAHALLSTGSNETPTIRQIKNAITEIEEDY